MDGELVCQDFHRWIHTHYSNRELAAAFHDLESLYELRKLYDMVDRQ